MTEQKRELIKMLNFKMRRAKADGYSSECGAKHEHKSGKWMNYCPNCGAKVVDE